MSKHEGFALYCKVMMTYMMVMIKAMRFEEDLYDDEKDRDDDDEYAKGGRRIKMRMWRMWMKRMCGNHC